MKEETRTINLPIPDTASYITISGLTKEDIEILLAALMKRNVQQESDYEIRIL